MRALAFFLLAVALPAASLLPAAALPASYSVGSPDGRINVTIRGGTHLAYDLAVDGQPVLQEATLALQVDEAVFGPEPQVLAASTRSHDGVVTPVVKQKAASLRERYNELRLELAGGAAVVFRAYNEGAAYRWETRLPGDAVKVRAERAEFRFSDNFFAWYPEEDSMFSHNERFFLPRALADLAPKNLASIPVVVDAGFCKVALTDSNLEDYPGLWFQGTGRSALTATFPPYPLEEHLDNDRDLRVTRAAGHLAVTQGTRAFPWRVLAVAHRDADLLTNPLVYLLQDPSRIADPSWIKPGKVAWDWWNANNLGGVDFKAGVNTATYKAFIDFAADYGLPYVILDEGWYRLGDCLAVVPEINLEELVAYGNRKNVGLILWVVWKTLDDQLVPALDQYAKWGVKGIKVDFMQRDDQPVIAHYHRVCREAAARHLLVDFHGAIRPAQMTRTWPNLLTAEGVRGNEWNKWSNHITPEHTVTLPFTRMLVGPLDFTPGAMQNATRTGFRHIFDRPMSQGTRCRQLAMYVVYESPLQMLCDSPTQYRREPEAMEFLAAVPTTWDETVVPDARIGDYVVVARRAGPAWYLGAMTDGNARELSVDLSFLPPGRFQLDEYADGVNADRRADDCRRAKRTVTRDTRLTLKLAEGGGYAARLTPE